MPAVDDPFGIAASLPGQLKTLRDQVKDLSVNRTFSPATFTVGAGGLTVLGPSTLTGGVTGPLAATGALSGSSVAATGAITGASVTVTGAATSATSAVSGNQTVGGNSTVSGQIFIPNGYAAVSAYTSAYIDGTGRLSVGASALKFKQDFEPVDNPALVKGILAADTLHFRLIAAVDEMGDKAPVEIGLLADQLETIGLGEFVYRDEKGGVLGIHYERLTVPLIAAMQDIDRRLRAGGL